MAIKKPLVRLCSQCCCCFSRWKTLKSNFPPRKVLKIYAILFINLLSHAYAITMLFPFLPFMVKFLVPGVSDTSVGQYVGVVGGSLFVGRFFGSYFWGVLGDKKGRKPIIIICGICVALSMVAFGFSVNIGMAILARFLVGLFNGTISVSKAMVSEISDDKSQALGISIIGGAWGSGFIIGPAISGAIADPIGQYNLNISNAFVREFLTKFPYSLPCLANCILFAIALPLAAFCLPETLGKKKNRRRSEINNPLSGVQVELRLRHESCNNGGVRRRQDRTRLFEEDEGVDVEVTGGVCGSEVQLSGDDRTKEEEEGVGVEAAGGVRRSEVRFSGNNVDDRTRLLKEEEGVDVEITGGVCRSEVRFSGNNVDDITRLLDEEDVEITGGVRRSEVQLSGNDVDDRTRLLEEEEGVDVEAEDSCLISPTAESAANDAKGDEDLAAEETARQHDHNKEEKKSCIKALFTSVVSHFKNSLLDMKLFLSNRITLLPLLVYCVYSYGVIGFNEIFSLWAFTQPHYGGLGFSLHQIGIVLSVVGAMLLPVNLFAFAILEKYLKSIKTFYVAVIASSFLILMIPHVHYIIDTQNTWLLWVTLITITFLLSALFAVGFSSIFMFINNSVTFDKLGSINGIAMSLTSVTRSFAPILSGVFFSFSLSKTTLDIGFPLDYNFVFLTFSVMFLICVFLVACLPVSINRQKIIEDEAVTV